MKQKISVRAIIQQDGKTLLLRRSNGRATILGKYELPGGKIAYGEQPEDALRRYLHDDADLHIKSAQLFDAVTYIDRDDSNLQYVVITYNVNLSTAYNNAISLSGNYDKYKWEKLSKNHHPNDLTDLTALLLGIIEQEHMVDESISQQDVEDTNAGDVVVTIYADGGSRGNPGPSAAGFVMLNSNQEVVEQAGEYLGITTNNQAEYQGVRLGLEHALAYGAKRVNFRLDSMLVVNQMNGIYRIKNRELWPIHERIRGLMTKFHKVTFSHVQREFNQLADSVVNKTLDDYIHERDVPVL